MKPGKFNAQNQRIMSSRQRQYAVRSRIAQMNGGPSYLRNMRMEALGEIQFYNEGDLDSYTSAMEDAKGRYGDSTLDAKWPLDDAPYADESDKWSNASTAKPGISDLPSGEEYEKLWLEAEQFVDGQISKGVTDSKDRKDHVVSRYKTLVANSKPMHKPFKSSTMQLSPPSSMLKPRAEQAMKQMSEITTSINNFTQALNSYNEEIKTAETQFHTAQTRLSQLKSARVKIDSQVVRDTTEEEARQGMLEDLDKEIESQQAFHDNLNTLLSGTDGLREKASRVRSALFALERQRAKTANNVGVDPQMVVDARKERLWEVGTAGVGFGVGGFIMGAMGLGYLVYLARRRGGLRLGRATSARQDPVGIFINN